MRKKSIILGLVLFFAGTAALGWGLAEKRKEQQQAASYKLKHSSELNEYLKQYNEWLQLAPEERAELPWGVDKYGKTKPKAQLQQEQQERLKADLDRLATGETDVYPFADILYGENWRRELDKYKTRKETRELVVTVSILCMLTGGTIFSWWLLIWTARLANRGLSNLKKFSADCLERLRKTEAKELAEPEGEEGEKTSEQEPIPHEPQSQKPLGFDEDSPDKVESPDEVSKRLRELEEPLRALRKSGWQDLERAHRSKVTRLGAEKIAVLLSDESSVESEKLLKAATEKPNVGTGTPESSLKLEDSLKAQTDNLEKQVAEFGRMAQSVRQTAIEHSEPLNNTLLELTQQVAAIREYANRQQDRVKKLQDGYDWNIIRNFCLRIIRCVDNLESRISRLSKQDIKTPNLEEIRDELVFALESSGVERFEPEVNSDYRGQERCAEAVKDKECSDDPNLKGKIAKVIRPGYQYVIDEENVKVVRTAQVKLYG